VKPGYKQTKVGVIPENWEVKTFAQLFAFRNGVNADKHAYGQGIRFVNVLEPITYSHLYGPEIPGRVTLPEPVATSFTVRRGDVLFNRTSETQDEVGLAATYLGADPVVFGGFVIRGRPTDHSFDPTYSGYALRAPFIRSQIVPMGQGAIRANVGQRNLSLVVAPVPPLVEQCSIAEALSDADALIKSVEQLLDKKRQLKQGAMQVLLTGKKRLPGFSGDWDVKRLAELADIRSGGTPSTTQAQFWNGTVPWCTPTDVTGLNGFKYLRDTSRKISHLGLKSSSAEMIPAGSVVMTSRATIGECAINQLPVTTNQGFKNFVPSQNADVEFLYYLLITQRQGFISLCGGSTFLEIGKTQLTAYEVCVPTTKTEQIAIAAVLSDMDAEIAALEERLAKARALKQGMMQELLTGRIRLV
jgi:type I restriction enzyme S subunit